MKVSESYNLFIKHMDDRGHSTRYKLDHKHTDGFETHTTRTQYATCTRKRSREAHTSCCSVLLAGLLLKPTISALLFFLDLRGEEVAHAAEVVDAIFDDEGNVWGHRETDTARERGRLHERTMQIVASVLDARRWRKLIWATLCVSWHLEMMLS